MTGFASAASGTCEPHAVIAGRSFDTQPGCPKTSEYGWDATWAQLKALSPAVYSFGIEAGASAHFEQAYDRDCFAFNACMIPGETVAAYENRVLRRVRHWIARAGQELGPRFSPHAWVVPYSDLGYRCEPYSCAYENYNGPKGWLIRYAAGISRPHSCRTTTATESAASASGTKFTDVTTLRDFAAGPHGIPGLARMGLEVTH